MIERLTVSTEADSIIKQLRRSYGEIIFHMSGGCCDGSAPNCLPGEDFLINESDVLVGTISNCNFFMAKSHFEYMRYSQITLDVTRGKGSAFSLEIPLGYRFITKSRIVEEGKDVLSPAISIK